jgi:hypothetical protein
VERALAQRWLGRYALSGGAIWTAPTAIAPDHNLVPGAVDCSGFDAYCLEYPRGDWNCNNILADAWDVVAWKPGPETFWTLVHHGEPVYPSDVVVHAGADRDHNRKPDPGSHGHTGVFVEILPGFESLHTTPELARVAHSSGMLQFHVDPSPEAAGRQYGTVRVTGAELWALNGYIVRAKHVVP